MKRFRLPFKRFRIMDAIELLSCSALSDSNICPPKLSISTSSNIRRPTVARNLKLEFSDNKIAKEKCG